MSGFSYGLTPGTLVYWPLYRTIGIFVWHDDGRDTDAFLLLTGQYQWSCSQKDGFYRWMPIPDVVWEPARRA